MPKIIINGATHELADDVVTLGRSSENMIHIADPSVSSRHAEFRLAGDIFELRDLGSTNGTRVNGVTVTEAKLRPGDRIRFGGVEGCYECDPGNVAQPLPEAAPVAAQPAEVSARPVDFANASPFGAKSKDRDPSKLAIFAVAAAALLAWLGSMIAVLLLRAPHQ